MPTKSEHISKTEHEYMRHKMNASAFAFVLAVKFDEGKKAYLRCELADISLSMMFYAFEIIPFRLHDFFVVLTMFRDSKRFW